MSNQWARYLLTYLYAVSDEDYDDDDTVSIAVLRRTLDTLYRWRNAGVYIASEADIIDSRR